MRALALTTLLCATAWAGEAPRVTLIVVGAEAARVEAAMAQSRDLPVELAIGHLPQATAPKTDGSLPLSSARQKYVNGDFAGCLQSLSADALVPELLAAGRRELAARVLFWRVACRVGSGALPAATDEAREFAALGLEVPADAAEATPEVESLLGRATKEAAAAHKLTLAVDAPPLRAGLSLDGRSGACVTPCALEVLPGEHLIALDADGYLPLARQVSVHESTQVKLNATPAPPEVAAAQWSARYGGSTWLYSEPSTRLLARAVAARRLVLVNVEGTGELRLRGTLATDGTVRAQAERTARAGSLDAESRRLLRDLLVSGKVFEPAKPIYKRAAFWVPLALAVSAAVISASIAATLAPNIHTRVGF
ncbi:MAG TPA: PEGA domain-containing protein [Polyangia bacterium]